MRVQVINSYTETVPDRSGKNNGKDWAFKRADVVVETRQGQRTGSISIGDKEELPSPGVYDVDIEAYVRDGKVQFALAKLVRVSGQPAAKVA